jgi:hypothetical protein
LQHPLGHVALHPVHTLSTQFWVEPHGLQADPPLPHAALDVPARQVVPEQQPVEQDVPLQTHAPPTHAWPLPHGAFVPHLQAPPEQRSEFADAQVLHAPPPVPQADVDCGSHTLPLQQPVGHDVALHTQLPPTQACPMAHCWPEPQLQLPPAQESARPDAQPMHVAPLPPHWVVVGIVHVVPAQHPLGHEVALHTQAPLTHSWPAPHGAPVPQAHAPAVEQVSDLESHETHALPPVPHALIPRELQLGPEQHPVGQLFAQPEHVPFALHVSPLGQLAHELPPLPHWLSALPASQTLPLQHPVHDV